MKLKNFLPISIKNLKECLMKINLLSKRTINFCCCELKIRGKKIRDATTRR